MTKTPTTARKITPANPHGLKVGDTLYLPASRMSMDDQTFTIHSIGRLYAVVDGSGGRITLKGMREVDGRQRQFYFTKRDYLEAVNVANEWLELARDFGKTFGRPPAGVTIADILQARAILNLRKPEPAKAAKKVAKKVAK